MDYNIEKINEALLSLSTPTIEMQYDATAFHYTDSDKKLIKALKLNDPKSHKLFLKNWQKSESMSHEILSSTNHPRRCDRLKNPLVLRTIEKIDALIPEQPLVKTEHDKMYVVQGNGQKYHIPENRLKTYALAVEEQREYMYRGDDGSLMFFWRLIDLPDLHQQIMAKFYDFLYTGPITVNASGNLSIYIDGEEFSTYRDVCQQNWYFFSCRYVECKSIAYLTFDGEKIWLRMENHSPDKAHSHNDTPPYVHEAPVDVPKVAEVSRNVIMDSARLQPTNVTNANFKNAALAEYTKHDVLIDNTSNLTYIPRGDRVNGCRVWRCSKNSKTRCIALAMTEKMRDGTERAIFDGTHVHLKFHSLSDKPPVFKRNFAKLRDDEYTEAVEIKLAPRGKTEHLTHLATKQLYYKHHEGGKHTSWHCQYKSRGCGRLLLTRVIGANQLGFITNDHTRGCPLFASTHNN